MKPGEIKVGDRVRFWTHFPAPPRVEHGTVVALDEEDPDWVYLDPDLWLEECVPFFACELTPSEGTLR